MRGPTPGFRGHLITAIVGTVGAIATFLIFFIGGGGADLGEKYQVRALVPTVNALAPGARVTMAGAKVGRVAEIRRHGVGTEVRLDITDDRVTPVPLDSRITVRQRTPVGENYVSIAPGRSRSMLASGGVLPPEQSDEYVDVDQVLSVLSGPTRERARKVIRSLGGPLRGRGEELHRIVGGGSQSLQSGARVLEILSPDREQIAALVRRLGAVSSEVQDSSRTVATLATKGLRSTQALAARDDALRRTLEELPGTLRQARTTSERLSTASAVATPVVANLAVAVRDVRPAVRTLRPAAQEGRRAVRSLSAAARPLEGTLERLRSLSGPLVDALPELDATLCQLNPAVRFLKPYTRDAVAAVQGLGSASNSYDAVGHLIRLTPIIGENSLAGAPEEVTRAAHALLRTGFLSESHGLTWNPYPEPGRIGNDAAGPGKTVFGPQDVPATGYKFPRVHADC